MRESQWILYLNDQLTHPEGSDPPKGEAWGRVRYLKDGSVGHEGIEFTDSPELWKEVYHSFMIILIHEQWDQWGNPIVPHIWHIPIQPNGVPLQPEEGYHRKSIKIADVAVSYTSKIWSFLICPFTWFKSVSSLWVCLRLKILVVMLTALSRQSNMLAAGNPGQILTVDIISLFTF